jgi:hypothetical protein
MANLIIRNLLDIVSLVLWASMWIMGGLWLVRSAFSLEPGEETITGFATGLIAESFLANILSHWIPAPLSFWLASFGILLTGFVFLLPKRWRAYISFKFQPAQWILLILFAYIFTGISRGLALYDDYAHLPTTSMMASGDIPPHFSLDPKVSYGYHYFLMLVAAQIMRLGDTFPWTTLDISRGISVGLLIVLAYIWTKRFTRNQIAGVLGGCMAAFGMGARWLLLLLPSGALKVISQNLEMLGSGAQTASDLSTALTLPWATEGSGVVQFPFAFVNGVIGPGIMAHGPNGAIETVVTLLLLLTCKRWKDWRASVVTIVLLASTNLMSEANFILLVGGFGIITIIHFIQAKSFKLPKLFLGWWMTVIISGLISLLQGGALTDAAVNFFNKLFSGTAQNSYQTIGFVFNWPPQLVSSHLGALSLINPGQLLIALCEVGPILFVLPLLIIWGMKALGSRRYYEAALAAAAGISFLMIFVEFSGSTGVRNTNRLYTFTNYCLLFAVPLVWIWAKNRPASIKLTAIALGGIAMLGGIVLFGNELAAMQKPVYSTFITDLDVSMEQRYWNQLEPGALVFDSDPSRATTLFGRPTDSNTTWYETKPEWDKLNESPRPEELHAYGFSYAYMDKKYWDGLTPEVQESLQGSCVKVVKKVEDWTHDYRVLLDIRRCSGK